MLHSDSTGREMKKPTAVPVTVAGENWWRGQDSNLRPLGYEPSELPLLYPAMFSWCKGMDKARDMQVL